jgi:hypothetical protein
MKVEKSFTIGGEIVQEVFKKGSTTVYKAEENDDSGVTLYFVNSQNNEIQFKLFVGADCNQNFGFIGTIDFTDIK